MKRLFFTGLVFVLANQIYAQSTDAGATGNVWGTTKYVGWNASNGINPLVFKTNNINRIRLNGNQTANISFINQNTSGYLGISPSGYFNTNSPWSMLHLEGPNNTIFTGAQWRSWMKTGLFMRENSDAMYVGLKQEAGTNRSDAIVSWSDDAGSDRLRFLFTGTSLNGNGDNPNNLSANSFEGYEFMRMESSGPINQAGTLSGHVAIGPQFTPRNRLHMNAESALANYLQISNSASPLLTGTGFTANDGLKFGIQPIFSNGAFRQTAFLQWQENTPFIVQTDWDNTAGGTNNGERMRITSIGALNNTVGNFGGLTTPANRTRIAISADGANPITKPLSLLHLGYNTGAVAITPGTDGWRSWMDIGMFTTNGTDNVYLGLKDEGGSSGDRQDAVLSWGDNQVSGFPPGNGPDNFRMIFTSTTATSGGGTPPATGVNGLEGLRMTPTATNGVFTGIGGDPTANQYGPLGNSINPTATLEVNSWNPSSAPGGSSGLRFTNLNTSSPSVGNPGTGVLSVDANGDVIYVPYSNGLACWDLNGNGITDPNEDVNSDGFWNSLDCQGAAGPVGPIGPSGPAGASIGAHNGTSISALDPSKISLGNDVGSTIGELISNREIPMNGFNILFTDVNTSANGSRIGVGTYNPQAKLDVNMSSNVSEYSPTALKINQSQIGLGGTSIGSVTTVNGLNDFNLGHRTTVSNSSSSAGHDILIDGFHPNSGNHYGLIVKVAPTGSPNVVRGISAEARNGIENTASSFTSYGTDGITTFNRGTIVQALANDILTNWGIQSLAKGSGSTNIGTNSQAKDQSGTSINYGIYAEAVGGMVNHAGYFAGTVVATGGLSTTSDSIFKQNVNKIPNALEMIVQFKPVTYNMDTVNYTQFNFPSKKQYGFIAQDVAQFLPEIVKNSYQPGVYDSVGNEIIAPLPYKSINYTSIIPIITEAVIELNQKVEKATLSDQTVKRNIVDLSGSLNKVLAMRGISYDWNHSTNPALILDSLNHIGFIAQEIHQIDDRLTFLDDNNLLHVEYDKVVPIIVESIEELNTKIELKDSIIEDLNSRLTQLENCLSGILPFLCQLSQQAIQTNTPETQQAIRSQLTVILENKETIILDQNVPNPFAEQTTINFSIPESVKKAQIQFYDGLGSLIQTVDVRERGLGSLTVFGSDLSSGTYLYKLVADGILVATKKMVKE